VDSLLFSPEIVARKGERIHSQSVLRHLSFPAAPIFRKKKQEFFKLPFALFFQAGIDPWALRENNTLELANQRALHISKGL